MVCIFRGDTDFPRKIASVFLHLFSYTITLSGTLQHRNHSYTITYITYLSPNKPWSLFNKCIIHFFVHQTRSEMTPQCSNFCQIRLHRVTALTVHAWTRLWCYSPKTLFLFYRTICPVLKKHLLLWFGAIVIANRDALIQCLDRTLVHGWPN